jgi:hypothetical protein
MSQTIQHPNGQVWTVPPFIMSPAEAAERDQLLAGRYFLVRQGSLGEIFRCRRCNRKHGYMTLMCVERPFSGIAEGLWAYFQTVGTPEALKRMTPAEKRRLGQVTRYFAPPGDVLPDIATLHPRFARGMRVPERDALTGAVPLGILDEIPASLAQRYVTRINAAGLKPPLVLPGLTA